MFIGKEFPSPPHSYLNFIKNEEELLLVTDLPKGFQITFRWAVHPPLSLDGFQHHCACFRINGIFHCPNIIKGNVFKSRHQRLIPLVELFLSRCCQGRQSSAMKGPLHSDHFVSIPSCLLLCIFSRQFHRPFIGLCPAITKENFISKRVLTEKGRKLDLW